MSIRQRCRESRWLFNYGMAVVTVLCASGARYVLERWLQDQAPMMVFSFAPLVSAYVGGLGPGLVATALSVLAGGYLFVEPHYGFWPAVPAEQLRMVLFLMVGSTISILMARQRQAQQALARSERRFRELANAMPQLVWSASADGTVDYYNERYREMDGIERGADGAWQWRPVLHPNDAQPTVEAWERAVASGGIYRIEHRVRMRTGQMRWHLSRAVPTRDERGRIVRWFGTSTDIHELREMQEGLAGAKLVAEQAKTRAEEASLAKDHFLAVLSHELRTPLTPVLALVSMLEGDAAFDPETRDSLGMIRRNVELEARLIDDLLDMTRIARGKVELDRRRVDLRGVIRRAMEVVQPDAEARGLHIGFDEGDEARYEVEADATRLQQAFWNLLKNAVKFTPQNGCVGVRCRREGGEVVAEVNDSGIGIDPADLPRLFNAFEQAERSITRQFGGLGLGLAISKALVEMHGGTISARSEGRGKGATFAIRLPLLTGAPGKTAGQGDGRMAALPEVRRRRILLVEDHGDTARIMKRLLMAEGHEVQTAGDVATGMALAGTGAFDVLISDLGLPDGSGHDLLRSLRARGQQMPAIALSGYGQEEDVRRSLEAGFTTHLTKPINPERLIEAIGALGAGPTGERMEPHVSGVEY